MNVLGLRTIGYATLLACTSLPFESHAANLVRSSKDLPVFQRILQNILSGLIEVLIPIVYFAGGFGFLALVLGIVNRKPLLINAGALLTAIYLAVFSSFMLAIIFVVGGFLVSEVFFSPGRSEENLQSPSKFNSKPENRVDTEQPRILQRRN